MAKKNEYISPMVFHPGETLKEKLEELGMGPKEFAVRTDKPEKTIIAIMKGKSSITPEMAVQFENVLKIPAHFWLNIQRHYDEFIARNERRIQLKDSANWTRKFPVSDMVRNGWISARSSIEDKTTELLAFFGISSQKAWEDFYLNQELKVAFRISLAHTKEPYAISAWLRKGDLQALEYEAKPYDDKVFKESLIEIKKVMSKHPDNFFDKLQAISLEAGVKVVHTPCINKAPISGSTRWINDTPLIQLSARYKRNDIFWFTFFHEAGHILLHGKKDIFLEDIEYSDKDKQKEEEANEFAVNWTLTHDEEKEIVSQKKLTVRDVVKFAKKFETHPAIIIGRLQFKKYIPYSLGREFFEPVYLN